MKKGSETMPNPEVKAKANRRRFGEVSKWPGLKAIGVVINETKRDCRMTSQVRYYILSRKMIAKEFGQPVRGD